MPPSPPLENEDEAPASRRALTTASKRASGFFRRQKTSVTTTAPPLPPTPSVTPAATASTSALSPTRSLRLATSASAESLAQADRGGSPIRAPGAVRDAPFPAPTTTASAHDAFSSAPPEMPASINAPARVDSPSGALTAAAAAAAASAAEVELALLAYAGEFSSVSVRQFTAWLGDAGRASARTVYMANFQLDNISILTALRLLCARIYLRGEAQHIERILEAFAVRWCHCNPKHNFYSTDAAYTLAYSIVLLNTDLHYTDSSVQRKMTRTQFVTGTLDAISVLVEPLAALDGHPSSSGDDTVGPGRHVSVVGHTLSRRQSLALDIRRLNTPSIVADDKTFVSGGPSCATDPRAWVNVMEIILFNTYTAVSKTALPLPRTDDDDERITSVPEGTMQRGLSRNSSLTASRLSLDNVFDLPARVSTDDHRSGMQAGLTGALAHVIMKEEEEATKTASLLCANEDEEDDDGASSFAHTTISDGKSVLAMIDEELEILGAPWAKEGIVKQKRAEDGTRMSLYKAKKWDEVFAVVQRGCFMTYQFESRNARRKVAPNEPVGDGNWTHNANMLLCVSLTHATAGYYNAIAAARGGAESTVFAVTAADGTTYVFRAGTSEIADEFISTCNYWAARVSKEPLPGAVSNAEYGWGATVLEHPPASVRDWTEPASSLASSTLSEQAQRAQLSARLAALKEEVATHEVARKEVVGKLPRGSLVSQKATGNWARRMQYLKREQSKYAVYVSTLDAAGKKSEEMGLVRS
ncbi:uncharacterized protein V1518DRAFT_407507 [Limtongia smithiae]|uniref:uncharacterized protein n=1 Tax=Limtongia smithiae TaxID=1125753 RepID=UPI0034CF75A4